MADPFDHRSNRLENSVLSSLGNTELHDRLGSDLDLGARGRVAAHACSALDLHEFTQAWNDKFAVRLHMLQSHVHKRFDKHRRVLFADVEFACELAHELGLGHLGHSGVEKYSTRDE